MVSRLISSISGMLSPPEKDSIQNANHADDQERERPTSDASDNYTKTEGPIPIERQASTKMSNFDLQFINAETMDRAIVNRLQSRMSTSVADVLVEATPSTTGVKTRCERRDSKVLQEPRALQQQQSRAQLQDTRAPQQQQPRVQLQDPRPPQQQQSKVHLQEPRAPQQQQSTAKLQNPKTPQMQQSRVQLQDPRGPQQQQGKVKQLDPRAPQQQQSKVQLQEPRAPQQQQPRVQPQESRAPQQQQSRVQQDSRAPPHHQSKVKLQETRVPPLSRALPVLEERNERNHTQRRGGGESGEETEQEDYTSDAFSEPDRPPPLISENTRSRHRSALVKESLSQSSVMSHDIPANMHSLKKMVHDSVPSRASSADERRSVMYRNSQFGLENTSKEALCSDSSKILPESEEVDSHRNSNALLNLPLFGIPDPSMHRMLSAASSSLDSIPANERYYNRELPPATNPSRRAVSPNAGRSYYLTRRLSVSQIDDRVFESSINDIIEKGGDDFKSKYSSWIWDAFRAQLVKLKSLMVQEFNEKLKVSLEEREYEFADLQKRYQDKLVEFETSTENFQRLMDSMNKDHQRMLSAKDFVIDKLKKEFLECKKHFEQDLQRQVQSFRKEAEVERMELQKRNDELMLIMLTDQSTSGLEDAFKNEIDSLHAMIKTLNARNELLNQQLEEATNATTAMNRRTVENLEAHLNQASSQLMEIQKKLQYADNEKEDLTVAHNQEIAKLNRKLQEKSTKYEHQLRDAMEELAAARKKHSREIKDFKQKMINQENQQKQLMAQVRQEYGSEVDTLSQAVCQLRAELTLRGASARLSQSAKGNDSHSSIR